MLEKRKYREEMIRLQRRILLRVISAYRTVSAEACQVVAGVSPIDLLARERCENYENGRINKNKRTTREKWQLRWRDTEKAAWTRRLIPDIMYVASACGLTGSGGNRLLSYAVYDGTRMFQSLFKTL